MLYVLVFTFGSPLRKQSRVCVLLINSNMHTEAALFCFQFQLLGPRPCWIGLCPRTAKKKKKKKRGQKGSECVSCGDQTVSCCTAVGIRLCLAAQLWGSDCLTARDTVVIRLSHKPLRSRALRDTRCPGKYYRDRLDLL